MAGFDIITAGAQGYQSVWRERAYLLRLAAVPVLLKFVLFTLALTLGLDDNILWLALILLPAAFAEGWMLSHLVRLLLLGQRWPFRASGDAARDEAELNDRAKGIMGGAILYALIHLVMSAWLAFLVMFLPEDVAQAERADPRTALIALAGLGVSLWAFRFLWLYIPTAVNVPLKDAVAGLRGFTTSAYLIGTWLMCFLPVILVMQFAVGLLLAPFPADNIPAPAEFVGIAVRVAFDTLKSLLCTAGIVYGLKEIMGGVRGR